MWSLDLAGPSPLAVTVLSSSAFTDNFHGFLSLLPSCFFPAQTSEQDRSSSSYLAVLLSIRELTFSTTLANQCGVHNIDSCA